MEEKKKGTMSENRPLIFSSLVLSLETCKSRDDYMKLLKQLEELTKTDTEIARAHSYLLSKYPNLPNVEPKTIAKQLHKYYSIESNSQKLLLDSESIQNLKKDLRKIYYESNVGLLTNSN